ncbi:MAG: prenyltransferase/squalene oxidase repeat-containing protein [Gemmataceae bacterium]
MKRLIVSLVLLSSAAFATLAADSKPASREMVMAKAIKYLKSAQEANGGWSTQRSPGITGVVLTALLKSGVQPGDEVAEKGLKFVEGLVNEKAGHIAGKDPKVQLQNYVTSVNVMALVEANRDKRYQAVIGNATEFLKNLQFDEGEGKTPKDDFYGGAGYDSKSRPDLSNTQFFLDALQAAGVPKDDPAVKRALIFVSRCQNFKSENNDRPWAGQINDGSFIYTPAAGGETKVDVKDGSKVGYGSMTYAGIKSMIYCGVSKDDPRIQKAMEWISKHYSVDENPGMGPQGHQALYYYYHTMAKSLATAGVNEITTPDGKKHNWRNDLVEALAKRQRPDGSWVNEADRWMEGDPNLVTAYALLALSYCK